VADVFREPLAMLTVKEGEVEIAAVKGAAPPVQEKLMLPVLAVTMEGTGATAREGTAAASRQAAATKSFARGNIFIV
jgi:hypothetical protein